MSPSHSPPTKFDSIAALFADYGVSVRGYVRYKVIQNNLAPFIEGAGKELKILDIGGGSGPDTGWLASLGHKVTLVEPSQKQREFALRRFNYFLSEENRRRIEVIDCDLSELKNSRKYDLVLIHGVAMYQQDPEAFIVEACSRAKKGGLISVVEKNYHGALARATKRLDFESLQSLRQTSRMINSLSQDVYAFLPEELESILVDKANAKVLQWSGIRVACDGIIEKVTALEPEDLEQILEVEMQQGVNPHIRGTGQMVHFIAKKK
jgi:protein-L-isoaspartate O-methyltransferase